MTKNIKFYPIMIDPNQFKLHIGLKKRLLLIRKCSELSPDSFLLPKGMALSGVGFPGIYFFCSPDLLGQRKIQERNGIGG